MRPASGVQHHRAWRVRARDSLSHVSTNVDARSGAPYCGGVLRDIGDFTLDGATEDEEFRAKRMKLPMPLPFE